MLSEKSTEIVRATLPVIGAAIGDITPIFYQRMFAARPDLITDLFNRGNQAQGDQQKALAGAIAVYATLLVDPAAPSTGSVLGRIAHKHASLGILPEQYAIVHEHLFAAIVEVLGEVVTPDVAAAWDEVYWHMAHDLVAAETALYREAGVEGGDVWRDLVVSERRLESTDTVSFVLAAPDGSDLPPFSPGQYVSVQVELPDGARQIRQYSLSWGPQRGQWRIGVRRILAASTPTGTTLPAGEVSNHLYENAFEGDLLHVSLPFGDLALDDADTPLLLVSAGIGCTPMLGMLDHLAAGPAHRTVAVVHADRSPSRHAHRAELKDLVDRLPDAALHTWYEDAGTGAAQESRTGYVDLSEIDIAPGTTAYLCGPLPFMSAMRDALVAREVPADRIHYETFGPDSWLVGAPA
ncbi:hemin transporter [Oerskovia turbata]|uniref:nitric oxide dioxygenase n=1 Tax=Oerskovia turbata TaxID=1713 RepID=A0A4Q1KVY7_9CELL|nr:globin domain-containing protein [Oerskovia turbata]RXR25828.1 hemin transporter [Oerskovia turbata]RXR33394.1 hemin transporter [Oerskovia turbata]TGJ96151.1 hemin transporter [Actinotalea fermentans ATCC 43279 = JCM 9966 = DSM 3133]